MRNRVLITSVGRKVSLVKAFKEAGWVVDGADTDPNAIALKFCDDYGDVLEHPGQDLWIPTRDAEIEAAWNHNGWNTTPIKVCQDKLLFSRWCEENGFRAPKCYFVKPRVSKSGKETECVWQEMIVGEEYSVDLFADFGGNVISVVPRRRLKVINGESVVSQTVRNDALLQESIALSNALGLVGHNVLQGFWINGSMVWADVNCRFGGASIVAIRAGCKSPEWLLGLVNGKPVKPQIGNYIIGLTGYSYSEWNFEDT